MPARAATLVSLCDNVRHHCWSPSGMNHDLTSTKIPHSSIRLVITWPLTCLNKSSDRQSQAFFNFRQRQFFRQPLLSQTVASVISTLQHLQNASTQIQSENFWDSKPSCTLPALPVFTVIQNEMGLWFSSNNTKGCKSATLIFWKGQGFLGPVQLKLSGHWH